MPLKLFIEKTNKLQNNFKNSHTQLLIKLVLTFKNSSVLSGNVYVLLLKVFFNGFATDG